MPAPEGMTGQDGASGDHTQASSSYTDLPDDNHNTWEAGIDTLSAPSSPIRSPSSDSPAKSRMRMDPETQASSSGNATPRQDQVGLNLPSTIANYPTSGQPVLDTTMKDMLLSLQASLMLNISAMINNFASEMQGMGERVQHIEHKMDDCTSTVNDLIDAYKEQADDTDWIKAKLADLEDRSRRNNVKLRGVPESVSPPICRNMRAT